MPLFELSSGAVLRLTNDCYHVATVAGFPLSFPVTYKADATTPLDLSGFSAIKLELFAGYLDSFAGTPVKVWDQTANSWGQIAVTPLSGLAVFTMTAAGSADLPKGDYSFRWVTYTGGALSNRTFFGRWRHRA